MRAFCYASGQIVFSRHVQIDRALLITIDNSGRLRKVVSSLARHAYDGKTLLVPGLPEARNWDERIAAFMRFKGRVDEALGRPALAQRIRDWDRKVARRRKAARGSH